jgi:hypothetical protein
MKLLKRFGCGCVGFDFGIQGQSIVEKCYDCDDDSNPQLRYPENYIREENIANAVYISDEETLRIFGHINELITKGRRLDAARFALGIKERQ